MPQQWKATERPITATPNHCDDAAYFLVPLPS